MIIFLNILIYSLTTFAFISEDVSSMIQKTELDKKNKQVEIENLRKDVQREELEIKDLEKQIKDLNHSIVTFQNAQGQVKSFEDSYVDHESFPNVKKWYKAYLKNDPLKMNRAQTKMNYLELDLIKKYQENVYFIKNAENIDLLKTKKNNLENEKNQKQYQINLTRRTWQTLENDIKLIEKRIEEEKLNLYSCDGSDEVRLDKDKISKRYPAVGPIKDVPVLDQDGLGTCYANAASLLYKSTYPDEPLLSHLDLAIHYYQNSQNQYSKQNLTLWGGGVCGALRFSEGKEICQSEGSLMENGKVYEFDKQIDMINDVSRLIDGLNHTYDPELSKKLKTNSESLIALNPYDHYDYSSMLSGEMNSLFSLQQKINFDSQFRHNAGEQLDDFDKKLDFYVRHIFPKALVNKEYKTFSQFEAAYKEYFKSFAFAIDDFNKNIGTRKLDFENDLKNIQKIKYYWDRMPENNETYLSTLGINECLNENQLTDLIDYFEAIKSAKNNVDKVFFKLLNEENNDFAIIRKLIHPQCTKHKVQDKIECSSYYGSDPKQLRYKILSSLYSDKPKGVGISYCANVLEDIQFDSNKEKKCPGMFGQSYHASVIIGARKNPTGEGCEYLVQNSWGAGCSKYYDPSKCENGKIWLTEDAVIKNMTSIYTIGN